MQVKSSYNGLVMPSLIWLAAIAAALLGAVLRGLDLSELLSLAAIGVMPAVLTLMLTPILRKEWAQILVLFAWLSLGIVACLGVGFMPMALLFLCAPVAAALFEKEKVVEALIMGAIIAAVIFYAQRTGSLPKTTLNESQSLWSSQAALMATLGLIISTLLGTSYNPLSNRSRPNEDLPSHMHKADATKVLNAIEGGVVRFDNKNNIVDVSDKARSLLGLSGKTVPPLAALMSGDSQSQITLSQLVKAAQKSKSSETARIETLGKGDGAGYLDMRATHIDDGVVLYLRDASVEEETIAALRETKALEARKNDDKSLFFAGVSHELRTPLNAIIGFSDMMRSRLFGPLPSKYAEYADLIHDSGQHMLDLIGDVLDMSKVEAGKYELHYDMFDASDVIRSTVKMIRPSADAAEVRMDIDIQDDDALLIEADRKALRQILLNLISNAVKFSKKGGSIRIAAKAVGDTLNLTVQDHGVGMSDDELASLGTPYKQMSSAQKIDQRGTGLGIVLVKSLTDLHGGRFSAASQIDVGTTIDVFLPLNRPK